MQIFSGRDIVKAVTDYVGSAQQVIYLCVRKLSYAHVIKRLLQKHRQGVTVYLITQEAPPDLKSLPTVYLVPDVPDNYCVIDKRLVLFGNFIWAYSSKPQSVFATTEEETVRSFMERFEVLLRNLQRSQASLHLYDYEPEKQELKHLQALCIALETRIKEIESFYAYVEQYIRVQLGELILKKLALEKALLERKYQYLNKKVYQAEAEQKQAEYEAFYQQWASYFAQAPNEEESNPSPPSQDLKELYRKIAQKIHPDKYRDEPSKYQKATEWFIRANKAYQEQDQEELQRIWEQIENGWEEEDLHSFDPASIHQKIAFWRAKKETLEETLVRLQQHEFYPIFAQEISLEDFVETLRTELEHDIRILETDLNQIKV